VRHQHERDRGAVEDDVVLVQPARQVTFEVSTALPELRQLDEVLQLEVVDVSDQGPAPVR